MLDELATLGSDQAAARLAIEKDEDIARTLEALNPAIAVDVLWSFTEDRRERIMAEASPMWAKLVKEAWLGLLNGALVGVSAGLAMLVYASVLNLTSAPTPAAVVTVAMTGACITSGIAGVAVPVVLRRLSAEPATASSIFLTTATDCTSIGLFLGLATLLLP